MPYKVVKQNEQFCVFKHDEDGEPVGDSLGCHDTEREAQDQMAAIYASEGAASKSYSLDKQVGLIRNAWYQQFKPQTAEAPSLNPVTEAWVHEVLDDAVIVERGSDLYSYPYTLDGETVTFDEPVKVEVAYKPIASGKSLAIKMLSQDDAGATVGGYLLLWGDPKCKDLQGDYFTKATQLWTDKYPTVPALFHHGLDDTVGLAVMGHRVKALPDATGLWVEDWLDKSNRYWAMVEPLLKAERLYYSPGSAPHLVKRAGDGELLSFPVIEDTLTPIPAQHRLLPVEQIKTAYKAANLTLPDLGEDGAAGLGSDHGGGEGHASVPCLEAEAAKAAIDIQLLEIEMEDLP